MQEPILRSPPNRGLAPWPVRLDVGGTKYSTVVSTLLSKGPRNYLASRVRDALEGAQRAGLDHRTPLRLFIDRDGEAFRYVLNYLRDGDQTAHPDCVSDAEIVVREARFFGLKELEAQMQQALADLRQRSVRTIPIILDPSLEESKGSDPKSPVQTGLESVWSDEKQAPRGGLNSPSASGGSSAGCTNCVGSCSSGSGCLCQRLVSQLRPENRPQVPLDRCLVAEIPGVEQLSCVHAGRESKAVLKPVQERFAGAPARLGDIHVDLPKKADPTPDEVGDEDGGGECPCAASGGAPGSAVGCCMTGVGNPTVVSTSPTSSAVTVDLSLPQDIILPPSSKSPTSPVKTTGQSPQSKWTAVPAALPERVVSLRGVRYRGCKGRPPAKVVYISDDELPGPDRTPKRPGSQLYTMDEIAKHNHKDSCWLVVQGRVYDVTNFLEYHPGSIRSIIAASGGGDCAKHWNFHSSRARKIWRRYEIGRVAGHASGCCSIM